MGGTSLASPLVAAMYALAGTPQPGTYPVTYPYHDPNQAGDVFDITQGTNGSCGNVLCAAGPGWDGPTGLGTPNGVTALTSGPHGLIGGQVSDSATGKPVAGATVSASPGGYATLTGPDGTYQLDVQAGTYDLTVKQYGYQTWTLSGVRVAADQTIAQNVALTPVPSATLSGTVTDGSGHGWPLHAAISIPGYPAGAVYTDPVTGRYSVTLPQGDYTLTVVTDDPGYQPATRQVTVDGSGGHADVALAAHLSTCTAPGYGWAGSTTDFTGWTGATPRGTWTITGTQAGWRFDNPGNRPPPQTPPAFATGGDDDFAVADSGATGGSMDTSLTSPAVSLAGQTSPEVQFDTAYYAARRQAASVDLSVDGGQRWTTIWQQSTTNAIGHVSVPVPSAAGKSSVRVRFHYTGSAGWYWAVDDVFLGTHSCVPQHGGLLLGVVTDQATGKPINGAQVARTGELQAPAWPAGIAQGTADPALPGGFYWLFAPSGSQQLTATGSGYTTATATVNVSADMITRRDFALSAHGS